MTDLIRDTGARGEGPKADGSDVQKTGGGGTQAPGGAQGPSKTTNEMTQGQESYAGPRDGGETDKPGAGVLDDRDASTNNAQTPPAGDLNPEETAVSDETGQAGVNDRPGKDTAHPWNG
jgi:hypothetical protein